MTEQKLTELLRDMSLEEKVNQMSQVTGGFFNGEIVVTGPMTDPARFTLSSVNPLSAIGPVTTISPLKNPPVT